MEKTKKNNHSEHYDLKDWFTDALEIRADWLTSASRKNFFYNLMEEI